MKYPEEINISNKKYKLIKIYTHFGLYEDEMGFKRCFDLYDLGKIKKIVKKARELKYKVKA